MGSLSETSPDATELAVAVLVRGPGMAAGSTVATIVTVATAPIMRSPSAHVTTEPVPVGQVPRLVWALTAAKPAGSGSVSVTAAAFDGPVGLATVIRKVARSPAATFGSDDLSTTSAAVG